MFIQKTKKNDTGQKIKEPSTQEQKEKNKYINKRKKLVTMGEKETSNGRKKK